VTADFVYVRWGGRKAIESRTVTWDKTIIDRREDLRNWVEMFRQFAPGFEGLRLCQRPLPGEWAWNRKIVLGYLEEIANPLTSTRAEYPCPVPALLRS